MRFKKFLLIVLMVAIVVSLGAVVFTKPVILYKVRKSTDYNIWSDISGVGEYDDTVRQDVSITFNDITYKGKYISSIDKLPYHDRIHKYEDEEVEFSINAETGELVEINFSSLGKENKPIDEAYCKEAADNMASNYIDLNKYKVDIRVYDYICIFEYYREFGGLKSADGITICVRGNGDIKQLILGAVGSFSNVLYVKTPDENKVAEAFDKVIPQLYDFRMTDNLIKREFKINDVTLIKTPNEEIAYLYDIVLYFYYDAVDQDGVSIELKAHDDAYFVLV